MSVLIKGMETPKDCWHCYFADPESGECLVDQKPHGDWEEPENCPLVPVPPHGRLIDADALRAKMYHEAFETDSPMQKWDSGCWIRYKMFERMEENAPTIIPAEDTLKEATND